MKRLFCMIVCLLVAAAPARGGEWDGVAFQQKAPQGMFAWFVLPTRMVLDDADLPANASEPRSVYRLSAARNETECVQLVLMLASPLEKVSIEFGEFSSGDATIAAAAWRSNVVAQVPGRVPQRSSSLIQTWPVWESDSPAEQMTPGMYSPTASRVVPDPLLRDVKFDLDRGINRVWLTVRVPREARPGDYQGVVRVQTDGRTLFETPLALRVWKQVLPDEPSVTVLANVWSNLPPAAPDNPPRTLWDHLKPYYDNLKAHRINATGEIYPTKAWKREEPPPDLADYERALKYVLDNLGFARFRFPGVAGAAGGVWQGIPVFRSDAPQRLADGWWISGASFAQSFPPGEAPSAGADEMPHWTRVGGDDAVEADFGAATLAGYSESPPAWVEYEIESTSDEPQVIWLQVEPVQEAERKVVSVDGEEIGAISNAQFEKNPLGFARLEPTLRLKPGKHTIRVTVQDVVGAADPIYGIFITPSNSPDFELLLRERARLSEPFKHAFEYHTRQMSEWLRRHNWMKKAHAKLRDEPGVGEFGRVVSVYDFAGEILPSIRREISTAPSPILRRSAEVWAINLAAAPRTDDEMRSSLKPSDELWGYHNILHTLGYPSISMRLIPWTLGREGMRNYVFWSVNQWASDPWRETTQGGAFMRGTLLYPDPKTGEPVNSVRWELFREGLEDFEMLRLLRTAMDEAAGAKELDAARKDALREAEELLDDRIGRFVRSARDFSWDPVELEAIRTRAGELLSVLTPDATVP